MLLLVWVSVGGGVSFNLVSRLPCGSLLLPDRLTLLSPKDFWSLICEVLLQTNALLLDREGYATHNLPNFDNSIIINPVSIGKDCTINNSNVGPHVTIGENARIESTIIQDSIIGNYASIKDAVLRSSIIGNDTSIKGFRQSLNIGDNTEIDFS